MEKPNCYGECPLQQWLYDSHEQLEETMRRRLISDDPYTRLTPDEASHLRIEQTYFQDISEAAARTCRGLVTSYLLNRTVDGASEATPTGKYCEAAMPANLRKRFSRPQPQLPDNR